MAIQGLLVIGALCAYLWRAGFLALDRGTSRAVLVLGGTAIVLAGLVGQEATKYTSASTVISTLSRLDKLSPQQSVLLDWLQSLGEAADAAYHVSGPLAANCDWCAQDVSQRGLVAVLQSLRIYLLVQRLVPYALAVVAVATASILSPHAAIWRGISYFGLLGAFGSEALTLVLPNIPFDKRILLAKVPTAILLGNAALVVTEAKFLAGSRPGNNAAVAIAKCNTLLMSRLGTLGASALAAPVVMGDSVLASNAYTYWQHRQQQQAKTWEQIDKASPPLRESVEAADNGVHTLHSGEGKPLAFTVAGETYLHTRELMGF